MSERECDYAEANVRGGKKRTSLLLVNGEGRPVLLLDLLQLLVNGKLLLRREALPLSLDVGQGDGGSSSGSGWVDGGGTGLVGGRCDPAGTADVGGAESETRTRQAQSLHVERRDLTRGEEEAEAGGMSSMMEVSCWRRKCPNHHWLAGAARNTAVRSHFCLGRSREVWPRKRVSHVLKLNHTSSQR